MIRTAMSTRPEPGARGLILKAFRGAALAVLTTAVLASGAIAANSVSVSGLNPYVVTPGQTNLEIDGSGFPQIQDSSDDCNLGQEPVVHFIHLGDGQVVGGDVHPIDVTHANCSNEKIIVPVPQQLVDAYSIQVTAFNTVGQPVTSNGNFQVTVQPSASPASPSSGPVGTSSVTVSGSNLRPPSVPSGGHLQLSCGSLTGWSNGAVTFNPNNQSCNPTLTFNVVKNSQDGSTVPISLSGGSYQFLPPALDGGSQGNVTVGQTLTLTGSNLGGAAGTVGFPGSGGSITATPSSWSPSQLTVAVPSGAQSGNLSVTIPGYGPGPQYPNGPVSITVNPLVSSYSPLSQAVGQPVSITGYNFGAQSGDVTIGQAHEPIVSWSDRKVVFTMTADTDGGSVTLIRTDGQSIVVGNVAVVPSLGRLTDAAGTATIHPGDTLEVDGTGFGSQNGTVVIDGADYPPQLWSRDSVLFALPATIGGGNHSLSLISSAGTASAGNVGFAVVVPPAPTPGSTPKPGTTPAVPVPAVSPFFDLNHQFHKPPKAASPVDLTLDAEPKSIPAGGTASLTVTLKLNGKPVPGATIKLSMIYAPCTDYAFTPASGTTDATGVFKASVKICGSPGSNIILAQSGIFSDQDQVVGTGATPSAGASHGAGAALGAALNPTQLGPILPLVGLGTLGALLVALGLFINLRSSRTS